MENIQEIRRQNLDRLIGNPGQRGRIAEWAQEFDLSEAYVSQILNGHRKMGEKSARNFEKKIGLEPGKLDEPPQGRNEIREKMAPYLSGDITPDEVALVQKYRDSSPALREAALRFFGILEEKQPKKRP